jgi:hypothetical protein
VSRFQDIPVTGEWWLQSNGSTDMKTTELSRETDLTWMKFADLLVETGVISDCVENRAVLTKLKEKRKQGS